jgi:hypothetical protein
MSAANPSGEGNRPPVVGSVPDGVPVVVVVEPPAEIVVSPGPLVVVVPAAPAVVVGNAVVLGELVVEPAGRLVVVVEPVGAVVLVGGADVVVEVGALVDVVVADTVSQLQYWRDA